MDYIVIDVPPCGAFEDVFLMEEYADGVLFVVKQDHASQGQILGAVAELEAGDLPIIGYVFNGVSGVFSPYSYGKYGRYGKYRTYGHYKVYGEESAPQGKTVRPENKGRQAPGEIGYDRFTHTSSAGAGRRRTDMERSPSYGGAQRHFCHCSDTAQQYARLL